MKPSLGLDVLAARAVTSIALSLVLASPALANPPTYAGNDAPGALDHLLKTYKNLYCDLSAGSGAGAISRDLTFGREFLLRHQDRILFGTDYLAPKQDVPQFELFQSKIELPGDVVAKISSDNARQLLDLPIDLPK